MKNHIFSPTVSICIASYNHENFVAKCIESALKQTLADIEIIIVDDCSSDQTFQIVSGFTDHRIKYSRNSANMGVSFSLNRAISQASSPIICISGSDDIFHHKRVERQYEFLSRAADVPIVFSDVEIIDASGTVTSRVQGMNSQQLESQSRNRWLSEFFHGKNRLFAPTAMFKKDAFERLGGFDPRLLQTQDLDLWIRFALAGEIGIITEKLMQYRVHETNLSTGKAYSDANKSRLYFELGQVLTRFEAVTSRDQVLEIVDDPNLSEIKRLSNRHCLAIAAANSELVFVRNFGLSLLFDLLADACSANLLNSTGFGYNFLFNRAASAGVHSEDPGKWLLQQAANWEEAYNSLLVAYNATEKARDYWHKQSDKWEAEAQLLSK